MKYIFLKHRNSAVNLKIRLYCTSYSNIAKSINFLHKYRIGLSDDREQRSVWLVTGYVCVCVNLE
jgi:hypothetical protein